MYCTNCGKQIPDDAKFCPYCGNTIISTTIYKDRPKRQFKKTNKLHIFVIVFVCALAFILSTMYENGYFNTQEKVEISPVSIAITDTGHNSLNDPMVVYSVHNNSDKTIDGVKIHISCYDNFNNEVLNLKKDALMQQQVVSNKSSLPEKIQLSFADDAKTVRMQVNEIHFTDGTTWKRKDNSNNSADHYESFISNKKLNH